MTKHIDRRASVNTTAHNYAEAFRKAYPQKTVVVIPWRNAARDYEFKVWINGDDGDRRLTWEELTEATAAFLRA